MAARLKPVDDYRYCSPQAVATAPLKMVSQPQCKVLWPGYLSRIKTRIFAHERLPVLINLRELLDEHIDELVLTELFQLLDVCEYLCDWPLINKISAKALVLHPDQSRFADAYIKSSWILGNYAAALDLATRYLFQYPANQTYYDRYHQLKNWQLFLSHKQFDYVLRTEKIYLEPLGHQHADSFLWQYADPQIAQLCCLPVFQYQQDWHQWLIAELATPECFLFAIIHPEWGFIGVVSFTQTQGIGFFYYWIGKDFQGNGFGPAAVDLMLDYATCILGMECCFAKVFHYNQKSIRGLQKTGFEKLPIQAAAPYQDELFFYKGENRSAEIIGQQLITIMQFLSVDIGFV